MFQNINFTKSYICGRIYNYNNYCSLMDVNRHSFERENVLALPVIIINNLVLLWQYLNMKFICYQYLIFQRIDFSS